MKTQWACVYDNPKTGCREGYTNGKLCWFERAQLLSSAELSRSDWFFEPFQPNWLRGDYEALPTPTQRP